jgi:hypothetical protein
MTMITEEANQADAGDASAEATGKRRGYATRNLPVIGDDDEDFWSVSDAARLLGPPELTEAQVRQLVQLTGMIPAGKKRGGSRRRHVRVYQARQLIKAYAAIASVIEE